MQLHYADLTCVLFTRLLQNFVIHKGLQSKAHANG